MPDLTADSATLPASLEPDRVLAGVTSTDSSHVTPYDATVLSGLAVKEPTAAFRRGTGN